jgi:hypothetical protein
LNAFHELATSCLEANEKLRKLYNIDESDMVIALYIAPTAVCGKILKLTP